MEALVLLVLMVTVIGLTGYFIGLAIGWREGYKHGRRDGRWEAFSRWPH